MFESAKLIRINLFGPVPGDNVFFKGADGDGIGVTNQPQAKQFELTWRSGRPRFGFGKKKSLLPTKEPGAGERQESSRGELVLPVIVATETPETPETPAIAYEEDATYGERLEQPASLFTTP